MIKRGSESCVNAQKFLLRIPVSGSAEAVPVPEGILPPELPASLLQTDVTERYRVPVMPEALQDAFVLCYLIDARGGERSLPVNFIGTCFYHTGCPIYGDLLLCACTDEHGDEAVSGLTAAQTDLLRQWLAAQFPEYSGVQL